MQGEATLLAVLQTHQEVSSIRASLVAWESALSWVTQQFLSKLPVRVTAGKMGISAPYLSDVRAGRRKVSDEFVEKLRGLK